MPWIGFLLLPLGLGDEPDWKAYKKELHPDHGVERREQAILNVAFYDSPQAMNLLLESLGETLARLEDLEEDRAANDAALHNALAPQIQNARDPTGVNYAGLEGLQEKQKHLGERITEQEQVVRAFRDALAGFENRDTWPILLRAKDHKKHPRLRLLLLDVLARMDDPVITEYLVELLHHKDPELQKAAADALSHHSREHVPVPAYGALLHDEDWQLRAVAIDALGRLGGTAAIDLLVHRTPLETGHLLTEMCSRLEILTGQKLGKTPAAWLDWWEKNQGSYQDGPVVLSRPITAKGDGRMEYWGIRVDSLRVVFVIDVSGSMAAALDDYEDLHPPPGKARIDLARRQLKAAIGSLTSDAMFNLIAYNDIVLRWEERLQPAREEVKKRAFEWLDQLQAAAATNVFDALEAAFTASSSSTRDRYYDSVGDTILFLSDGAPTAGRTTDCEEILAQVREWNRTRKIAIHCFGIGKQLNRDFMKRLAEQNGGQCRFIE